MSEKINEKLDSIALKYADRILEVINTEKGDWKEANSLVRKLSSIISIKNKLEKMIRNKIDPFIRAFKIMQKIIPAKSERSIEPP